MTKPYRLDIPPHVADVLRHLAPDITRSVKAALRAIARDPAIGVSLQRELAGLLKYRVRRYRIVFSVQRTGRVIRVMAVGHRRRIYDDLADALAGRG